MSTNRRDFLRNLSLTGGAVVTGLPVVKAFRSDDQSFRDIHRPAPGSGNMCGYQAPKLDKVRIGIVGLGMRGPGAVQRMSRIENVNQDQLISPTSHAAPGRQTNRTT